MPSASFLLLLFLYFRKFTSGKIFSELDGNLRRIFIQRKAPGDQRETWGATHWPGAATCRDLGPTRGWDPPCPMGTPSAPSDAYKITLTLKTPRRPLFSREDIPTCRHLKPSSGVILKQFSAPCRRGDRSRRALHRHAFLRDDL